MSTVNELTRLVTAEQKRRKRRKALGNFIVREITVIISALIVGWELMLAVGIAHRHWLPMLPTIGYWWTVVIVILIRPLFMPLRVDKRDEA